MFPSEDCELIWAQMGFDQVTSVTSYGSFFFFFLPNIFLYLIFLVFESLDSLKWKPFSFESKVNWKLNVSVGKKHQTSSAQTTNQSLILIKART